MIVKKNIYISLVSRPPQWRVSKCFNSQKTNRRWNSLFKTVIRKNKKTDLYLRQNTFLWAASPLGTCPTQTRQSRGRPRAGRSSETLLPSGSYKTNVFLLESVIEQRQDVFSTSLNCHKCDDGKRGFESRLQYHAAKGGKGSRIIPSC